MAVVNAIKLSEVLNLTESRVHQLAAREGMPKVGRGQFDLISCIRWYIKYLQTKIEEHSVKSRRPEIIALRGQQLRRLRAAADLKEMEVASRREQLVKTSDVRALLSDMAFIVKARFMSIPATLSAELLGETSRVMIQAKIEKAFKNCLNQIADEGMNYPSRK
jgi:phage terminase Nu1 subunit (DNA packaging protein)